MDPKNYVRRPALDLIFRAIANPTVPHVLILDEMNLSHVERYFADFLSAMESNEPIPLFAGADKRGDVPAKLKFPSNLFVIGTVNVDETTYMFSPKVLDRAHVIEFRMPATALTNFLSAPRKIDLSKLDGQGHAYGASFVDTANADLPIDDTGGARDAAAAVLQQFFEVLQPHNAEFGFRTANEAMRFVAAWQLLGGSDTDEALDYAILQKLLPKLHGSRAKLEPVLKDLLAATLRAGLTANFRDVASFEKNHAKEQRRFPESADKLVRMWRVLERDQFASFAEA